jgi:hypothetical protein
MVGLRSPATSANALVYRWSKCNATQGPECFPQMRQEEAPLADGDPGTAGNDGTCRPPEGKSG